MQQLLLIAFILFTFLQGAPETKPGSDSKLSQKLSMYMKEKAAHGRFNGSVIVIKDTTVLLAEGYGWANMEDRVPNTSATKFRIGSITKQFTAMAIMILREHGKLGTEDKISDYIRDAPSHWSEITIHQLLTHTSGIVHSWNLKKFADARMQKHTLEELIDLFKDEELLFSPGADFHYSGAGYFILARIIEEVSGQSYGTFLRQEIFEPLEMHGSSADLSVDTVPGMASGYIRKDMQLNPGPGLYMPNLTGGGNLYSTVEDMGRWHLALATGKLISDTSYSLMFTPVENKYAYGWTVKERAGRIEMQHAGGVSGFKSIILRLPAERVCTVVLSNVRTLESEQQFSVQRIARDLITIACEE